jgi:NtrC-family two-component system response regulator AlgB
MQKTIEQPLDILVIEQENVTRQTLVDGLQGAGRRIANYADTSECMRDSAPTNFDLAFIPQDGNNSRIALAKLHQRCPHLRVVLTVKDGVTPDINCGGNEVVGCVRKPMPVEHAQQLVRCVAELRGMEEELAELRSSMGLATPIPVVRPFNTRMRRVTDRARRSAGDRSPLLLRGEFGVGKRVLAGLIHEWGPHPKSQCILVNAATKPGGVTSPRAAAERLRRADSQGTLIFEEIGEFTCAAQDEIRGLVAAGDGVNDSDEGLPTGVKIVATTSHDLSAAAQKGKFHEELLSLLMDEALYLPPLRERQEDIVNLAERMLAHFCPLYHRPAMTLEPEAKLAMARHPWPGNIHELRNSIERVVLAAHRPEIGEAELRLRPVSDSGCNGTGNYLSLDAMEKQHILRVMRAASTLEEAARILHVDITTLWRKRQRYGV